MLYSTPVERRLGFMADLVRQAREGNPTLRHILTNKYLLYAGADQSRLFYLGRPSCYFTIAQAADRYCRKYWKAGVRDVVYGRVEEPPTGEVME